MLKYPFLLGPLQTIIFYTIRSPKLLSWLKSPAIIEGLRPTNDRTFADLDPIFNHNLDEDFDFRASGITRASFCSVYLEWIQYCYTQRTGLNTSDSSGAPTTDSHNTTTFTSVDKTTLISTESPSAIEMQVFSSTIISNDGARSNTSKSSTSPIPSPKPSDCDSKANDSKSSINEVVRVDTLAFVEKMKFFHKISNCPQKWNFKQILSHPETNFVIFPF